MYSQTRLRGARSSRIRSGATRSLTRVAEATALTSPQVFTAAATFRVVQRCSFRHAMLSHAGPVRKNRPVAVFERICFCSLGVALAQDSVPSELRLLARAGGLGESRCAEKGRKDCCRHELFHCSSPGGWENTGVHRATLGERGGVPRHPFGRLWLVTLPVVSTVIAGDDDATRQRSTCDASVFSTAAESSCAGLTRASIKKYESIQYDGLPGQARQ